MLPQVRKAFRENLKKKTTNKKLSPLSPRLSLDRRDAFLYNYYAPESIEMRELVESKNYCELYNCYALWITDNRQFFTTGNAMVKMPDSEVKKPFGFVLT